MNCARFSSSVHCIIFSSLFVPKSWLTSLPRCGQEGQYLQTFLVNPYPSPNSKAFDKTSFERPFYYSTYLEWGNGVVFRSHKKVQIGAVEVVAQLVERSLPIPEVRGSNPVIGKKYIEHLLSAVLKRRK